MYQKIYKDYFQDGSGPRVASKLVSRRWAFFIWKKPESWIGTNSCHLSEQLFVIRHPVQWHKCAYITYSVKAWEIWLFYFYVGTFVSSKNAQMCLHCRPATQINLHCSEVFRLPSIWWPPHGKKVLLYIVSVYEDENCMETKNDFERDVQDVTVVGKEWNL